MSLPTLAIFSQHGHAVELAAVESLSEVVGFAFWAHIVVVRARIKVSILSFIIAPELDMYRLGLAPTLKNQVGCLTNEEGED